jgi:hypothetical protein
MVNIFLKNIQKNTAILNFCNKTIEHYLYIYIKKESVMIVLINPILTCEKRGTMKSLSLTTNS